MPLRFTPIGASEPTELPALWAPDAPAWLRNYGRSIAFVIDDEIQSVAKLGDETVLREEVCEPLNVEFRFAPECARGTPLASQDRWFAPVLRSLLAVADQLAAVFLDLMFEGDHDPKDCAGVRFLGRLSAELAAREGLRDLPVFILTTAQDAPALKKVLAREGWHCGVLSKHHSRQHEQLAAALYERGWLSDPLFGAYARASRAALTALRGYAVRRPRLIDAHGQPGMPQPILITAESGEGKTRAARLAGEWLIGVNPPLVRNVRENLPQPGGRVVALSCSELVARDQGTKIALFGKGTQDPAREKPDPSGLVNLGATQQASGGILILDELGNSHPDIQRMLLSFVETGVTQPEFANDRMTPQALGPLDVLCVFTVQPGHISDERILPDLQRRYARGGTLAIPPLAERSADLTPLLFETLRARWPTGRTQPTILDDLILPEAVERLRTVVRESRLSVSRVVDLFSDAPAGQPIGLPYLETRLRVLPSAVSAPGSSLAPPVAPAVPAMPAMSSSSGFALVEQLRADPVRFPDSRDLLRGRADDVAAAAATLLLGYLEAAIRAAGDEVKPVEVYRLMFGNREREPETRTNVALTGLCEFLLLSREAAIEAFRRSDPLARLAVMVVKNRRSTDIQSWLEELAREEAQTDRLVGLGWSPPAASGGNGENGRGSRATGEPQ